MTAANASTKAQMIDEEDASGDETTISLWTRSHRRVTLLWLAQNGTESRAYEVPFEMLRNTEDQKPGL